MKKKTRKRSLCLLLAAALLLTSIPFDMTTSSKAEEKGTVVRDGESTQLVFLPVNMELTSFLIML